MSLADDRAAIAAAADGVDGVSCSGKFRQLSRPGDAVVRLATMAPAVNGFGFMATWQVYTAVSQDLGAAETWIDAHADELLTALDPELVVTRIEPVELVLDTGRVPAVLFEGTRPT